MTPTEEMVFELCRKTFLSFWSYPNPLRKDGKELCDVLIVCGDDVFIFSVKEVGLGKGKHDPTYYERWRRRAIEHSARQIRGAERHLMQLTHVIRSDNTPGIQLPRPQHMRVHRIAVALGSEGKVPIPSGPIDGSFIHTFDEVSLRVILTYLDTISDFRDFLVFVEKLTSASESVIINGGYEDLMGFYIMNERRLPDSGAAIIIDEGFWSTLKRKPEFLRKSAEDKTSYFWDSLIEYLREGLTYPIEGAIPTIDELEQIVRIMAMENRFSRRILSNSYHEWQARGVSGARICVPPKGTVYVFLTCPPDVDRAIRRANLAARCFVARGRYRDSTTVVGIATEIYDGSPSSFDVVLLDKPTWSDDDENIMKMLVERGRLFQNTTETRASCHEFPNEDKTDDS